MKTETRHPGTDHGKRKFWGEHGVKHACPTNNAEWMKHFGESFMQPLLKRGFFIMINSRCRTVAARVGVEKMRKQFEEAAKTPESFFKWLQEKMPSTEERVLDLSALYAEKPHATPQEIQEYAAERGFNINIA